MMFPSDRARARRPRPRAVRGAAWALAASAGCVLSASPAGASPDDANGPDWAFGHPAGEVVLGTVSALSLVAVAIPQRATNWGPDEGRPHDRWYGFASDFTGAVIGAVWQLAAGYGLEVSYYRDNDVSQTYRRAWRTVLVDSEATLLGLGLTYVIKRLTGRCRPRAWREDAVGVGRCDPDRPEHDAFPSGHTVTVSALAGSRLVLGARSQGASETRYGAFAFAEAASLVTGALRVLAGAHSWEDVLGGWGLGHGVGALVAFAHPMDDLDPADTEPAPGSAPQAMFRWSGRF